MSVTEQAAPDMVAFPDLAVRFAETPEEIAAVLEIRRRVFGEEQAVANAGVFDAHDARSLHALAVIPDGAIGTGRLLLDAREGGEAHIAWVATLTGYRRRGVAGAVVRHLLAAADEAGAPSVVLAAQAHAISLYRRLGFVPYGDRYLVGAVEHQLMARTRPERGERVGTTGAGMAAHDPA